MLVVEARKVVGWLRLGEMMGLDEEELLFMPPTHPTISTRSM